MQSQKKGGLFVTNGVVADINASVIGVPVLLFPSLGHPTSDAILINITGLAINLSYKI